MIRANITLNVNNTKESINKTFDSLTEVLEKRRKELLRKADIEGKKKLSLLKFKNDMEIHGESNDAIEDVPKLPLGLPQPMKISVLFNGKCVV